jgi:hypothetical protein
VLVLPETPIQKDKNDKLEIKKLGINNNTSGNTTYKPTSFDKDEILANNRSFMTSLNQAEQAHSI